MIKDPAFLFYSSDFLMDVADLTMKERGQYISLLCLQHQSGHLNKKKIKLNLGKISDDVLKKFQTDNDGNFYNERLENEIIRRAKFIEHQIENGKKGGRPKQENKNPMVNPNLTQILTQNQPKQKPLETETETETIINNEIINENINKLFKEYLEIRNKKKYIVNETIINRLINKLNTYGKTDEEKIRIIENAINGSWKDFYELNDKEKNSIENNIPKWINEENKSERATKEEIEEIEILMKEVI